MTPEGERLVGWAKRILAEQEAFKAEVAAVQSGVTGTLRLGSEPTASTTQTLPVAAFCAAHPLAKVHVASRVSARELHRHLPAAALAVDGYTRMAAGSEHLVGGSGDDIGSPGREAERTS